jgi:hypothetical protein
MNTLRIERLIDPNVDPQGAFEQTKDPWCSVTDGNWVVSGTSDCAEAAEFVRQFRQTTDSQPI